MTCVKRRKENKQMLCGTGQLIGIAIGGAMKADGKTAEELSELGSCIGTVFGAMIAAKVGEDIAREVVFDFINAIRSGYYEMPPEMAGKIAKDFADGRERFDKMVGKKEVNSKDN